MVPGELDDDLDDIDIDIDIDNYALEKAPEWYQVSFYGDLDDIDDILVSCKTIKLVRCCPNHQNKYQIC